jgi:hypothetical protein
VKRCSVVYVSSNIRRGHILSGACRIGTLRLRLVPCNLSQVKRGLELSCLGIRSRRSLVKVWLVFAGLLVPPALPVHIEFVGVQNTIPDVHC